LKFREISGDTIIFSAGQIKEDYQEFTMLHLHRASRSLASVLNYSKGHFTRPARSISSCTVNFNVSQQRQHFLSGSSVIGLQKVTALPDAATYYQKHFFSTKGKGEEEADAIEIEAETEGPPEFIHTHLPATVAIPDVWPYLPCIATSRNPVFPRFMKILEVSTTLTRSFRNSHHRFLVAF
jgi:hypothetical protein